MPSYIVQSDYITEVVQWDGGQIVDLTEERAAEINKERPGLLKPRPVIKPVEEKTVKAVRTKGG